MIIYPMVIMFVFFALNVPVAFSILASGVSYFLFTDSYFPPDLALQRMIACSESFPLMAVPFFIAVGSVMNYSGISTRLLDLVNMLCGHWQGGLAQVNVLLSTLMGGISGSGNADAAMQSKILVPQMVKRGMTPNFSAAVTATSAVIAPIIPPGIGLILYAFIADVSVARMFLAGYVPGILMCVGLMTVVYIIAKRRNYGPTREGRAPLGEIIRQMGVSAWALFLPFGIVLGLRIGMFTPTEAGAVSVFYSLFVGMAIYKELKFRHLPAILMETLLGTAGVMLIICAANVLSFYMSWERIPQNLSLLLGQVATNRYIFLLVVNVLLLVMGMFIETTAALIILPPLLIPIVKSLGIDPIHFGMVMVLNLTLGAATPPFGTYIFVCSSILRLKPGGIMRDSIPFLAALAAVLLLITYWPGVVLFLPNLILG